MPVQGTIEEARRRIEDSGLRMAVVTTPDTRLRGVVTNGEIRRSLLKGFGPDASVRAVMTTHPVTARPGEKPHALRARMRRHQVHQVPVVDENRQVVGMKTRRSPAETQARATPVVVMAGGLGTRLRPITEDRPKPLVEVGGVPILQTLLERLSAQGFRDIYLSVNYKADMIEDRFGSGADWGLKIKYLRENERRGTAGALSLLPERPEHPLLVLNGDLLTTLNFGRLVDFHTKQSVRATMCVRSRDIDIPYGVIETDGHTIADLEEKPTNRYFVNAGIYVLEPETLGCVPGDQFFDMTQLFQRLLDQGKGIAAYPVREYWRDIGEVEDLKKAEEEFDQVFR